ncbi:anti-repressor SinI family protein [Rossellomorea marisflavi]|uniref:anti-repressor SinI family protein n=1 Tax=Rossellomorea marisflavi TaxID=189381 RepID=UPI00345761A9
MGNRELDQEWVELMKEAKTAGITLREVKEFLEGPQTERSDKKYESIGSVL